jgi:hypothetical protein
MLELWLIDMSLPPATSPELTSWKEIATFLGVSVRTAQKWEAERGLPVRRLPGGRSHVSARIEDLAAWRDDSPNQALPNIESPNPDSLNHDKSDNKLPNLIRRVPKWAYLLAAMAVVICVTGYWAERRHSSPTSAILRTHDLIVFAADGHELWRKSFEWGFAPAGPDVEFHEEENRTWIGDLDGDGSAELLLQYNPRDREAGASLICYSADGDEKWHFRPGRSVRTRSAEFSADYTLLSFSVVEQDKNADPRIVLSSAKASSFPAQVVLLSGKGEIVREYWHAGHLPHILVTDLKGDGKPEIYLGGSNPALNTATLVVLDPENFGGASNESNTDFQLLGFAPAEEKLRVIFPRSRLSRELDGADRVAGLEVEPGGVVVQVAESFGDTTARIDYHLDSAMGVRSVDFGETYIDSSRRLFSSGAVGQEFSTSEAASLSDSVAYVKP